MNSSSPLPVSITSASKPAARIARNVSRACSSSRRACLELQAQFRRIRVRFPLGLNRRHRAKRGGDAQAGFRPRHRLPVVFITVCRVGTEGTRIENPYAANKVKTRPAVEHVTSGARKQGVQALLGVAQLARDTREFGLARSFIQRPPDRGRQQRQMLLRHKIDRARPNDRKPQPPRRSPRRR